MSALYLVLSTALILLNVFALGVLCSRWFPSLAVARAAGVLAVVCSAFFLEHLVGLGSLAWMWPLCTALSGLLLFRWRADWRTHGVLRAEAVFLAGFLYSLFWRASSPEITPSSERMTDLYFIVNYLEGVRLPPTDHWLSSLRFDFYYGLQHYGAALMARIFDLPPGYAYSLGFALVAGLAIALAWDFSGRFLHNRLLRLLVVGSLVVGGSGATPFLWAAYKAPASAERYAEIADRVWGNARFIGGSDRQLAWASGEPLLAVPAPGFTPRSLPSENFGYQFALGDFHPPLGGYFLLLLSLALIGLLEGSGSAGHDARQRTAATRHAERSPSILLGFTVPLQLATNTWVFPLQLLTVGVWALWRWSAHRQPDWQGMAIGGFAGCCALFPFLKGLAERSGQGALQLVRPVDMTPLPQFLMMHWPLLLFIAAALVIALRGGQHRGLLAAIAASTALMLALSEIIFFNDPSGEHFERTNTVMKWWGFIHTAGILSLGTLLLAQSQRLVRMAVVVSLASLNLYAIDVFQHWKHLDKSSFGALRGDSAYTRGDPVNREMMAFLRHAAPGVVLENQGCNAYCDAGIFALFAAKPLVLNWPMHQQTWRQNIGSVWILNTEIQQFYAGNHPRAAQWLASHDVHYIVWNRRDAADAAAWQRIDKAISPGHIWKEFGRDGDRRIGFWIQAPQPSGR